MIFAKKDIGIIIGNDRSPGKARDSDAAKTSPGRMGGKELRAISIVFLRRSLFIRRL